MNIYNRQANYKAGFGNAKKEAIYELDGDSIDQMIYQPDSLTLSNVKDGASSWLMSNGLSTRLKRDLAQDIENPRQEMPKSAQDLKSINTIPELTAQEIDMSTPEDYEASNAVRLYQESLVNSHAQETMFTDLKALDNPKLGAPDAGKDQRGVARNQVYSFGTNAAGVDNDRLQTDEDGAYKNSIESTVAF